MHTEKEDNNVISMFDQNSETKKSKEKSSESYDFESIMKKNKENSGRLSKDRAKSNRGVIRSYRLKH